MSCFTLGNFKNSDIKNIIRFYNNVVCQIKKVFVEKYPTSDIENIKIIGEMEQGIIYTRRELNIISKRQDESLAKKTNEGMLEFYKDEKIWRKLAELENSFYEEQKSWEIYTCEIYSKSKKTRILFKLQATGTGIEVQNLRKLKI